MPELKTYLVTQVREVQIVASSATEARAAAIAGFKLPSSPLGIQEVSLKVEKVR